MLPAPRLLRAAALLTALALGCAGLAVPAGAETAAPDGSAGSAVAKASDPRKTRGLFVDPLMPAANQEQAYRERLGSKAQALWIIPEAYPTSEVRGVVRRYTKRALAERKTPMLTIYGIPGRDCGQHSSGNPLTTAAQYRRWIRRVANGLADQHALVVLEPDALPLFSSPVATCPTKPDGWQGMLRFASRRLSASGAWVYLDAGHSNWTPYDKRPGFLKRSGIAHARGFSTNVSNFRTTASEKQYAAFLLRGLRTLGIRGKHYVIDTSRNGAVPSTDGHDVINPYWARVGRPPKLVFDGAFDGTLWVKHPGESDGPVNGGPPSGEWCDLLADRLLGRPESSTC